MVTWRPVPSLLQTCCVWRGMAGMYARYVPATVHMSTQPA